MRRWAVAIVMVSVAGCSLRSLDGFSSRAPPIDASVEGAAERADRATDAEAEASNLSPNVVPDPGFEGPNDCHDGMAYNGEAEFDSTAHSGSRSCKSCNTTGSVGEAYSIDFGGNGWVDTEVGTRWASEAWVRAIPGGPDVVVWMMFRVYDRAGRQRSTQSSPEVRVGQTWTKLELTAVAEEAGRAEILVFSNIQSQRTCFLADDLVMRAVP